MSGICRGYYVNWCVYLDSIQSLNCGKSDFVTDGFKIIRIIFEYIKCRFITRKELLEYLC